MLATFSFTPPRSKIGAQIFELRTVKNKKVLHWLRVHSLIRDLASRRPIRDPSRSAPARDSHRVTDLNSTNVGKRPQPHRGR